jgi:hypothetical protein
MFDKEKILKENFQPQDRLHLYSFLNEMYTRQVFDDGEMFSFGNMTAEEKQKSVIEDVLCVTVWEFCTNNTVDFGLNQLTYF